MFLNPLNPLYSSCRQHCLTSFCLNTRHLNQITYKSKKTEPFRHVETVTIKTSQIVLSRPVGFVMTSVLWYEFCWNLIMTISIFVEHFNRIIEWAFVKMTVYFDTYHKFFLHFHLCLKQTFVLITKPSGPFRFAFGLIYSNSQYLSIQTTQKTRK